MLKKIAFVAFLSCTVILLCRDLNPLKKEMFTFHDQTQVGRAEVFAENITAGHIPPRIAPEFSFRLGYPLYNYYAPTAYWITAVPILMQVYPISAMKLSFMFGIITAFVGMFLWLKNRFNYWAALLGATAYVTSPYLAVEIFVRGSISEVWFLALLPLSLFLLDRLSKKVSALNFFTTALLISLTLTAHNVLSLVGLVIIIAYILLHKIKKGPTVVIIAFLLSSYFFIPALLEMGQTYAVQVASQTKYSDHFLCVWQLWTSIGWNYGGSTKGCIEDGFSFKLGKLHVILAIAGVIYALWYSYKKKTDMRREILSVIGITFGSLFLTLYASEFIWHIFEKILKVFQFPWRFLVFGLFGVAYIISFGADQFKRKSYFVWGIIGVSILLFALNAKFFERKGIAYYDYDNQYLSEYYLVNHVAYQIPEYLPRSVNSRVWHSFSSVSKTPVFLKDIVEARDKKTSKTLKNQPYEREVETSSRNMYVNIHSAPYWHVYVNESEYLTDAFDSFGRPHVLLPQSAYPHEKNIVRVIYKQTDLEIISNVISVATLLVLIVLSTRYGRKSSKKE
jgi:hypothetical protein